MGSCGLGTIITSKIHVASVLTAKHTLTVKVKKRRISYMPNLSIRGQALKLETDFTKNNPIIY